MHKWIRKFLLLFVLISMVFVSVFASDNNQRAVVDKNIITSFKKPTIGENDEPTSVNFSWIGTGRLGQVTITNIGEMGYFEPPPGWSGYTGEFPSGYTSGNGNTGEFPSGTQQFYIWDAGLWVGAMVPTIIAGDTVYEERVAACAYYSDMGALGPIYQSNQKIPEGEEGAGDFLFKPRGSNIEDMQPYQQLWPYADTTINQKRREVGHPELQIDAANGDVISHEDTYTVFGDYWPEEEATTGFVPAYADKAVGIRVEQRTYSWSSDSYIYVNYRITNMTEMAMRDVYFGYFMDNDIGPEAYDDLIGYDADLNLGYSYDSDLQEVGWSALAGFVGTVFIKTPNDLSGQELGLTGFQTWENSGPESDVDNREGGERSKYFQLSKGGYEIFTVPQDVRQLACSGPYVNFEPGETVEITLLLVAGGSLDDIRRNAQAALDRYNQGYIGPEAPPSPNLTAVPGDKRVILSWDTSSETSPDPATGQIDFEGYRVYKSDDGGLTWGNVAADLETYPSGWEPIAEYDIPGNQTDRYVATSVVSDTSSAMIQFEGFTANVDDYYITANYTIEFMPGGLIQVFNVSQLKTYLYNTSALSDGEGFAIVQRDNPNSAYPDASYQSNELITFDGIFISVKNDTTYNDSTGAMSVSSPGQGAVYAITTFDRQQIGSQSGLDYVYEDEELTNGISYLYSVTAFDQGDPTTNLPSLESAISENKTEVIPRGLPVDRTAEVLSNVERIAGISDGNINVQVHNPLELVNAEFKIEFFNIDTLETIASHLKLINTTADTIVADSVLLVNGAANLSFYGLEFRAIGPTRASIDTNNFGWKDVNRSQGFAVLANSPDPFDYEIEFVNDITADYSTFSGDTVILPAGDNLAPWVISMVNSTNKPKSYVFPFITNGFQDGANLRIMKLDYVGFNDFAIGLQATLSDSTNPIQPGDVFEIGVTKPFLTTDEFQFSTTKFYNSLSDYSLDEIKVVPNPYYVRAQWDTDKYTKHLKFTHLPQKCTIRIFTVSGILIKSINHDENTGDPVSYHNWNLRTDENLDVASGLYIYQVKDLKTGKEKVGKFAVIL